MRIGIITNTYPPNLNGVSVSVSGLEKSLKQKGHEVFIACPEVKDNKYLANILPLKAYNISKSISDDLVLPMFYINEITHFFKLHNVEIVHTHDTFYGGSEGVVVAMNLNVPCVHTYHTFVETYNYWKVPNYIQIVRNLTKEVCNAYDYLIAPSSKIYKYLLITGVYKPIDQIYNLVDIDSLNFTDLDLQKKIDNLSSQKDFRFITFCRLAPEKGLDKSLEVLAPILKKYPNVFYRICGDGPDKKLLQKLSQELEISHKVEFVGSYQRQDLKELTKDCQAFLFTSTTDNLPTNIFEAMYLGLPVVAVDDESVDYLVKTEINGYKKPVSELTNVCELLYTNQSKILLQFSLEARKSAIELSQINLADLHIKLYQKTALHYKQNPPSLSFMQKESMRIYSFIEKSIKTLTKNHKSKKPFNSILNSYLS